MFNEIVLLNFWKENEYATPQVSLYANLIFFFENFYYTNNFIAYDNSDNWYKKYNQFQTIQTKFAVKVA